MSCILIVEDRPIEAALLVRYAAAIDDCETAVVETIAEARTSCNRVGPALVVLDDRSFGTEWLAFLRELRADQTLGKTPVLSLSAQDRSDIRREMLLAGANDFVIKPIDEVEFQTRARNLLELRAHRLALDDKAEWHRQEIDAVSQSMRTHERETVYRLARAAELRDSQTGLHLHRMSSYCELLARAAGESQASCELISLAAPMHDLGKVATPDAVLLKPGRHTADEVRVMKMHSRDGYEILRDSESPLLRMGADIALTHHERWDGLGYPLGANGKAIPLASRVVALADVFDALTSKRVYKSAWSVDDAIAEIDRGRATHFDPYLVDAFHEIVPEILEIRDRYDDTNVGSGSEAT